MVMPMVELPDAYYTVVVHGDYDWEIRMSLYPLEGYTKFSKKYCSAYEAYRDGSTLYSIRNQVPTVNTNRATFLTQARNGRSNSYAIYTYEIHKFITWCYVVEYATLNSQKAVNTALTEEGYHQGGFGKGITNGTKKENGANRWAFVPTGTTNSLGNGSGQVQYSAVKYYFRYADDMVILHSDKEYLRQLLDEIREQLGTLKLEIKSNYQIFKVEDRSISFVGYKIYHDYTLIRKNIKHKMCKKVAAMNKLKHMTYSEYRQQVCSHIGWMKHCNGINLLKKIIKYHQLIEYARSS